MSDQKIVRPFKASHLEELHVERRSQILLVGPRGEFRQFAGHAIRSIGERDAWARLLREHFEGSVVSEVLELASGTGEVTAVLLSMSLAVTAIDPCEPMIAQAAAKHMKAQKRSNSILAMPKIR
ncbi:class I SAM-dependent methyltransferase [Rhodopseudomonas palustris]|uniref:class I SAM-dependent methyltransferase n=1 Tax=Rhodopseudomonas palustris TaxID=1076 RepID=UPI0012373AA3|nr:class I SAM-dependent methyltransferase [Rhodopseudomonas palustris]